MRVKIGAVSCTHNQLRCYHTRDLSTRNILHRDADGVQPTLRLKRGPLAPLEQAQPPRRGRRVTDSDGSARLSQGCACLDTSRGLAIADIIFSLVFLGLFFLDSTVIVAGWSLC